MGWNVAGIGSVVVLYRRMTRYSMHVCRGILSIELETVLIPCLVILHISNVYDVLDINLPLTYGGMTSVAGPDVRGIYNRINATEYCSF